MRASRWETLGAWLRIWTPPRDVEIAPVPWRAVALLAAALAVATAACVVLVLPAVDRAMLRSGACVAGRLAASARVVRARLRV
ncbi:MAG: hypothetical protein QOG42_1929, partial [Solirubrobacteraceae bacterium]|nr:hypothetical protein [Solirubrobacteraceae bacterium]